MDAGGLLATTAGIENEDFMAGRFDFDIPGNPGGTAVNRGAITAAEGGLAALVAPGVENSGTIRARLGRVALASGNAFTLDFHGRVIARDITLRAGTRTRTELTALRLSRTLESAPRLATAAEAVFSPSLPVFRASAIDATDSPYAIDVFETPFMLFMPPPGTDSYDEEPRDGDRKP